MERCILCQKENEELNINDVCYECAKSFENQSDYDKAIRNANLQSNIATGTIVKTKKEKSEEPIENITENEEYKSQCFFCDQLTDDLNMDYVCSVCENSFESHKDYEKFLMKKRNSLKLYSMGWFKFYLYIRIPLTFAIILGSAGELVKINFSDYNEIGFFLLMLLVIVVITYLILLGFAFKNLREYKKTGYYLNIIVLIIELLLSMISFAAFLTTFVFVTLNFIYFYKRRFLFCKK